MPGPIRVFMADDHPVVLAGLKALVQGDPEIEIVGEARDGGVALREVKELRPDVAILDISMPVLDGARVARALRKDVPDCRVLALTVHEDRAHLRQLLDAGAVGYVLKRSAPAELIRAIHAIVRDGTYLDPAIAGKVLGRAAENALRGRAGTAVELTDREIDVLRLIATGYSNKEISAQLKLSVKTVETYKARGMEKLDFQSRVEIVRYAIGQGWLEH